jgi:hypothetical protein
VQQNVQQRQAVLAARHADQDAVTVADQVEIANRLGGGGDEAARRLDGDIHGGNAGLKRR